MTHPEGWCKGCFWLLFSCRGQESGGLRHAIEKVPDKPRLFHWWSFTTKLEPISKKMFEAKPRRLAHASMRCAQPEKLFLFYGKSFSGGVRLGKSRNGRRGSVGKADALRAIKNREKSVKIRI